MTPDPAPSSHNSSTSSAELDPTSSKPIYVYRMRHGASICSEKELAAKLSSDPDFATCKCSSIPIPRGASRVVVRNRDLWSPDEKARFAHYPNSTSSLASIGLPKRVYWRRMLMGHFQNLFIISPDHSPANSAASSANNSPEYSADSSRHVSPVNTFPAEEGGKTR